MEEKETINVHVGEQIRLFRKARRIRQDDMAKQCGISKTYYGKIERGENNVTISLCYKISQALSIRLCELFENLPD